MANFANLSASLNLNIQNFVSNLQTAQTSLSKFAANASGGINNGLVEPAKKAGFAFKDVGRIVQGILVSKLFYGTLNSIRHSTAAVIEFAKELEYAYVAYSNLFGSTELATEFINVLKDFAADTPFTFTQAEAAAKRLLAYGIEYKNVMYVMQGVLAASTMTGDPQTVESLSRALGQIYTKGKLAGEEVRQLAEAGVPVYDILQEKLGLTNEQLGNIKKTGIDAATAINAIVEGLNERFGGVLDAASSTMRGIISNLVDNASMLFAGLIEPIYNKTKVFVNDIATLIYNLRKAFDTLGAGGVFEALVPEYLHSTLRQLIANFKNLWLVIRELMKALGQLAGPVFKALASALNVIIPLLTSVLALFTALLQWITSDSHAMQILTQMILAAAAMWVVYKAKALAAAATAAVIKGLTLAVTTLTKALTILIAHPVWALLALGVGLLVGLSGGFKKVSDSIQNMFKNLTSLGGYNPDDILLPEAKDRAADIDKFNKALDGTADSMDELADSTGKATKAAKGLLSFDEVFKLKEPDEGSGAGSIVDAWADIDWGELGAGGGVDMGDLLPDVDAMVSGFIERILAAFKDNSWILTSGLGALFGAIIGGIFGHPLVGAAIGALVGSFWPKVAEYFEMSDTSAITSLIGAGLGAAIGAVIGGPVGAILGGVIGKLVGWLAGILYDGFKNGDWDIPGLTNVLTGVLGAAIGAVFGGPVGAAIGGLAGMLVGKLWNDLADSLNMSDAERFAIPLGTMLAAAIGFVMGGPAGALIGAAIGALISWIGTQLYDGIVNGEWDPDKLGLALGTGIGAVIGLIAGGPLGALIGAAIGSLIGWIGGLIAENWDKVTGSFSNIGSEIATAFDKAKEAVSTVFSVVGTNISAIATQAYQVVSEKFNGIKDSISTAASTAWDNVSTAFSNIRTHISDAATNARTAVSDNFSNIATTIKEKANNAWTDTQKFFGDIATKISSSSSSAWSSVEDNFSKIANKIKEKSQDAWSNVKTKFDDIKLQITNSARGSFDSVKLFFGNMATNLGLSINAMWTTIKTGTANMLKTFTTWVSDMWNQVFGKLFGWISDGISKIGEFLGLSKSASASASSYTSTSTKVSGHATGGIFNREHIARFAEGNKAEAIIPLEEAGAMQPFVDAVANSLTASLAPILSSINGSQNIAEYAEALRPLYVGTLIADERSLKELERRMRIVNVQETTRRGY